MADLVNSVRKNIGFEPFQVLIRGNGVQTHYRTFHWVNAHLYILIYLTLNNFNHQSGVKCLCNTGLTSEKISCLGGWWVEELCKYADSQEPIGEEDRKSKPLSSSQLLSPANLQTK